MPVSSIAYEIAPALDPAASVFVSANAGAGKTSLLTNRVLRLLLHGAAPSRILCLTFTNAAAAEMTSRVLAELGSWVMKDDATLTATLIGLSYPADKKALARARGLFAAVLEAPEGVRIQTIHGFCQSLLRRFPIEAGISPHFTVMDGRTEQELMQEARLRLFNRAQTEDPALQEALSVIAREAGEHAFHALLAEIIQHKRRLRSLFGKPHAVDVAIDTIQRLLKVPHGGTVQALIDAHFTYDDTAIEHWRNIVRSLRKGDEKEQKTAEGLTKWFANKNKKESDAFAYIDVFLTLKGTPRVTLFKKRTITDAALIDIIKAEQERVWRFADMCKAIEVARRSTHMLHVVESLLALYDAQKRARALMDFDDLILTACRLLQRPDIAPWVLFKLDGGIDHILVDEAQDTSPEQWTIIKALTEEFFAGQGRHDGERSLFVVGDEKQSIYSFQGADVQELGRVRPYFEKRIRDAAKMVHFIPLTHSFRSTSEVLSAVDTIFARKEAREGIMFEDAELKHTPTRLTYPGLVEVWPLIAPKEGETSSLSPATQLARSIAQTIQQWLEDGIWLEAKGRAVEAGDIMILVRNRTGLVDKLVRALKRLKVPVAGQDRMRLGDNLAVQDLIALGQCLLLPEDDLMLAALLKSPIFNLSEDELFHLAWQRERSVWERLRSFAGDKPVYKKAFELLTELRAKADFISPFELYSWLLDTFGARKHFTGRMGDEYNDPIDEFLNQALLYERSHPPSLQGFMHWLGASDSEIKRDMEQSKNCVRIMTVHGAKGLQSPIVILPDSVEVPKMKDTLLWHEDDLMALPIWPMSVKFDDAFCASLRDADRQAMFAEYRRLLYVALTRAEDRLYICGATGKEKINEQSWYHLVRTGLEPLATEFEMGESKGLRIGSNPVRGQQGTSLQPVSASQDDGRFHFLTQPAPSEPIPAQPLVPSRLAGDEPASASPLVSADLYRRGTLIHKLLQYLPGVSEKDRPRIAKNLAAGFEKALFEECLREASAIMAHPDFAFLFAEGSLAEVPVAGCVDMGGKTVAVAGQIDRLAVGEKEVWIVDFKSNREPPVQIPTHYLRQLQLYRLLLRRIFPDKTVRCALLWTAAARIAAIDDALLDGVLSSSYI